jgi:TonB family protein
MKSAFGLVFLTAGVLTATEVSGGWTGFMRPANGAPGPGFLELHGRGQEISGSIAFDTDERRMPLEKAELREDRLTFRAPDRVNHMVAFQLTVTAGALTGEATGDGHTFKVALFPDIRTSPYRVGPTVSSPVLIHKTEPEYTEAARTAKLQGTVSLYVEISPEGSATHMRVIRGLGMGLDEKALESVAKWQFRPGMKDGQPVTVQAQIEVNFRL